MRAGEMLVAVLLACGPADGPGEQGEATSVQPGGEATSVPPEAEAASAPREATATLLDHYDFSVPRDRFELPGRLDEISGLAMTPDGRLFAHDDERGRIHEIDPANGRVGKNFDLGSGEVRDDFEGIAIMGERFFLISSRGFLYEFREGVDEASVPYRVTRSGVASDCEVEGLDHDPRTDALVVACKTTADDREAMTLYRIPVSGGSPTPLRVARSALPALGLDPAFQPSAVAATRDGTLLMLSATTESILEIDARGRVLGGRILGRRNHPQPEGLALAADGTLFIADEKNGNDAHLTIYAPQGDPE